MITLDGCTVLFAGGKFGETKGNGWAIPRPHQEEHNLMTYSTAYFDESKGQSGIGR